MTQPNPHRREEILDAAERRFISQGYLSTSVAQLIADTGIAKGTFYHHFSSKEEVLDAVIARHLDHLRQQADAIAADRSQPAMQRFLRLIGGLQPRPNSVELTAEFERDGNELMQLRASHATVQVLCPPLTRVFADAVTEGTMTMADPEATAAVFLTITTQLIDRDQMSWLREGNLARLNGLMQAAEQLLGLTAGSFSPLLEKLIGEP